MAQNNEVLQSKRIVDLERDDSCLYWLCASAWENGKLIGNGKIQKLNISTRVVTTLADSLHAQDNIAIYGDSIYFGERGVQNPGLKRISKSGAESRILISGACGAVAVDSLSVTYFRIADSTLNSFDRIADSSRKLLHLPDSSVSIEIDSRYIYCVSQRQCDFQSTLRKISRETLNEVILNDSISCNPFFVVDSTVAYVSDDLVGGRIRQICNPEVIEGYNVIIPSTLDFGNIIIGQSSARVLPVMNASPNDVTIYASVVGGLFSIYPPSLSIPAHSTMPFTVRCNSDASDVQDQAVFSVNGPAPFATTVLTALGLLNTVENAPVSDDPVFRYTGNYLHVNLTSGRYALHVTDELGRVLRSWEGEGEGKIESFDLDIPNRLLFINLNQASSEHTMKIVRLGR